MTRDQDPPAGYGNPPKSKQFCNGHTPHNKRAAPSDSLKEAAARTFSTLRTVLVGGEAKIMSVPESIVREDVQKAVNGNVAAIIRIVNMLMDYPELIEDQVEYRVFITGPAARL